MELNECEATGFVDLDFLTLTQAKVHWCIDDDLPPNVISQLPRPSKGSQCVDGCRGLAFNLHLLNERASLEISEYSNTSKTGYRYDFVRSPVERLEVFQFRYKVLVEELGRESVHVNHAEHTVMDALDSTARILTARKEGELVGTLRTNFLFEGGLDHLKDTLGVAPELIENRAATSVTSRAAVLARYRKSTTFVRLAQVVYRHGLDHGITEDLIVSRPDLCAGYFKLGYRKAATEASHPEVGVVLPLRLSLRDGDHLAFVQSPFVAVLNDFLKSKP